MIRVGHVMLFSSMKELFFTLSKIGTSNARADMKLKFKNMLLYLL